MGEVDTDGTPFRTTIAGGPVWADIRRLARERDIVRDENARLRADLRALAEAAQPFARSEWYPTLQVLVTRTKTEDETVEQSRALADVLARVELQSE